MRLVKAWLWLLVTGGVLVSAACRSVPFERVECVPIGDVAAETVVSTFAGTIPATFEEQNTVTFEFAWRKVGAMGMLRVDRKNRTFAVVGLTHVGIKLFEISGERDAVTTHFILPELAKRGDLGSAIGRDIRRVYFDLVPPPSSEAENTGKKLIVSHKTGEQRTIFVFAGREGALVEKRYYGSGGRETTIGYYEYERVGGHLLPRGIILKNHRHGYRLIIRSKGDIGSSPKTGGDSEGRRL